MAEDQIPPMDHATARQVYIGWAGVLIAVPLTYFFGGALWAYFCLFCGIVLAIRGHVPRLFFVSTERQILAGIPARDTESPKKWTVALTLAMLAAVAANILHRRLVTPTVDGQLLALTCETAPLPIPYHGELWSLDVMFDPGGLARMSASPARLDALWPSDDSEGLGYRCQLANYSTDPVFNVSMQFPATLRNVHRDGESGMLGPGKEIKKQRLVTLLIPHPLGRGESFTFYVCGTFDPETFTDIALPSEAEVDGSSGQRIRVPLRVTSATKTLGAFAPRGLYKKSSSPSPPLHLNHAEPALSAPSDGPSFRLTLDCELVVVPINIQKSEMDILVPTPAFVGIAKAFKNDGAPFGRWPTGDPKPETQHCTVETFSQAVLVNVGIATHFTFSKAEHDPNQPRFIRVSNSVLMTKDGHIDIPILKPGDGYDFYVQNEGSYGVNVKWPQTATVGDTTTGLEVTRRAQNMLTMFPLASAVK